MTLRIGQAIATGFRTANRSWAGMAFFAGGWVLLLLMVLLLGVLGVALMRPPLRLFQAAQQRQAQPPASNTGTSPTREQPAAKPAPVSEETPPAPTAASPEPSPSVFTQLETTKETPPATPTSPPATSSATTPGPAASAATLEQQQGDRELADWFQRHWPGVALTMALAMALLVAGSTWIYGGQVGYVAQRLATQHARVSEFWVSGNRAFWPLLGSSGVGLLGGLGMALLGGLCVWLISVAPGVLKVLLSILFGAAGMVGLVWLAVRLLFWPIGIVVDRRGPISGLRASLSASRGNGWRLLGFLSLWLLIGLAVLAPFGIAQAILDRMEEPGAVLVATQVVMGVARWMVDAYLGFAFIGACVQAYRGVRPSAAQAH